MFLQGLRRVLGAAALAAGFAVCGQEPELRSGIAAEFSAAGRSDWTVLPNLALHLPKGEAPTPFLDEIEQVALSGYLTVELRGVYSFEAETSGKLEVEINGKAVLSAVGPDERSARSKPLRLNKGTNSIVVRFEPPAEGSGFFRVRWAERNGLPTVFPNEAISHSPSPRLAEATALRRGRQLVAELRCALCHWTEFRGMPELAMNAPAFEGIGNRLNRAWMADWIANPSRHRAGARMPRMLSQQADVEAVAAFLSTLRTETKEAAAGGTDEDAVQGQHLFQALRCGSCHHTPGSNDVDPERIGLDHVTRKFKAGALKEFLLNPQAHFKWSRMPNFKLSGGEAEHLARFLSRGEGQSETAPSEALVERGREVAQRTGCISCHSAPVENLFSTKTLQEVATGNLEGGCLAERGEPNAPAFAMTASERADLRLFLQRGVDSLGRASAREFAARQTEALRCAACHGQSEEFPPLEVLGGKLKTKWSADFIGGKVPYKPRPWLEARMPAFPAPAELLAAGLAAVHGFPAVTPDEPPIDAEVAEQGRKLVSAEGGFACASCHGIGEMAATQVFESVGINLAYSGERLLHSYFHRWVMNPLAIDPRSKMPVYFDEEGRSPLTEVYEGDGRKQIEAMWQYVRQGSKMQPPSFE